VFLNTVFLNTVFLNTVFLNTVFLNTVFLNTVFLNTGLLNAGLLSAGRFLAATGLLAAAMFFLDDAGAFLPGCRSFTLLNTPATALPSRGFLSVFLCGPAAAGLPGNLLSLRTTATLLGWPGAGQEVPR
jgi:hypothetical protein